MTQQQGEPYFNPDGETSHNHSEYIEGNCLVDITREDLVAERIGIESDSQIIRWLENDDSTTRSLTKQILKSEEEHACGYGCATSEKKRYVEVRFGK